MSERTGSVFSGMRGPHAFTFAPGLPALSGEEAESDGLSDLDLQLIRLLQHDGRRAFAGIARELQVPEKTVRRRVGELVDQGVIHITTVSYPNLLGFETIAMIGITVSPAVSVKETVAAFARLECVDYAIITTGRYHALVEVLFRNRDALLSFIDQQLPLMEGVTSAEVMPYLDLYYQEPAWEAAQTKPKSASRAELCAVDPVDYQIMHALHDNGRLAFSLVGQQVGLSESQVRKRVARLIEGQAMRITAIVNPLSLRFDTLVWIAIKTGREHGATEVADALTRIPSITYVSITAGRFDILAEAVCRTTQDVMRLVDGEVRALPGVTDTELLFGLDLYYEAIHLPGSPPSP